MDSVFDMWHVNDEIKVSMVHVQSKLVVNTLQNILYLGKWIALLN